MLATDLAAEAPEIHSAPAMTTTNLSLKVAALPQRATPASFASATDKLIANYAMQVEELRWESIIYAAITALYRIYYLLHVAFHSFIFPGAFTFFIGSPQTDTHVRFPVLQR